LVFNKNIVHNFSDDVVSMDIPKAKNRPTFSIRMEIFASAKLNELNNNGIDGIAWINY